MDQSGRPGQIFISYRREDSAYPAGWLYDRLSDRFGADQIFKDVDTLQPGDDFVDVITSAVGACDVLLAVIGPDWVTIADPQGRPRLFNAGDFVRLEIEAALNRKVLVIPLLVEGARMPSVTDVPPSLAPLVRRHALELTPGRFSRDAEDLIEVLQQAVSRPPSAAATSAKPVAVVAAVPPPGPTPASKTPRAVPPKEPRTRRWALVAVAAVTAVALGWGALQLFGNGTGALQGVDATSATTQAPSPSGTTTATAADLPRSAKPLGAGLMVWPQHSDAAVNIGLLDADGTVGKPLTSGTGPDISPVVSRDRKTVIYLHNAPGGAVLRVVGADGRGARDLFTGMPPPCTGLRRPAWSVQDLLAMACPDTAGRHRLLTFNLDGSGVKELDSGTLGDPSFSADGTRIVYWRNDDTSPPLGDGGALYEVPIDQSSAPKRLTDGENGMDNDPVCSPDGKWIAFRRQLPTGKVIARIPTSGDENAAPELLTSKANDQDPSWSPDSKQIVFKRGPGDNGDLWLVNVADRSVSSVLDDDLPDTTPAWTTR